PGRWGDGPELLVPRPDVHLRRRNLHSRRQHVYGRRNDLHRLCPDRGPRWPAGRNGRRFVVDVGQASSRPKILLLLVLLLLLVPFVEARRRVGAGVRVRVGSETILAFSRVKP